MNELLSRLKIDIGIMNSTVYDERLTNLLNVAIKEVSRWVGEGVDISDVRDGELVIDYAKFMWLNRREQTAMPVSLKYRLNCRAFERAIPEESDS